MTEIEALLCALLDAQSRQRIRDAWDDGRIDGDEAVGLLLDLDLLELPMRIREPGEDG